MLGAGGYFTYRFFQPVTHKAPPVAGGPGAAFIVPAPISKSEPASDFSPEWRYAGTFTAVSYTHLDVYKRQIYN